MGQNEYVGSQILLVEDEESLAEGLKYNLTEEGYRVTLAVDGKKAMEQFRSQSFDLVILDIMLPYLNGFEVTQKMREKDPQIPILILTARAGQKDRLKGLEIGADDYMAKPASAEEITESIKGLLGLG